MPVVDIRGDRGRNLATVVLVLACFHRESFVEVEGG